ncbi:apoptosis facilitator Bcl-2-like protein 14 [Puma concolor]|uniref:Apoptosis facilitator Bcl-2-like protein 14 n=1 Tax=Puma concolor TaxID=9696 RepID=A0A6P6IEN4_PUMCO|nr:apoptosis facilitator Bcl-2-like protein 14 [Puma concolor]
MCATSAWDLEEIPLDDDDPNSLEFKILAFYAKHHVFKNPPAASSPRPPRTRSLSQRGLGSWPANDSWTQVSWAWRTSPSPEQATNLGKKKSSWRALFGVVEKEENEQSLPTARLEGQAIPELHGPSHSRARSLSNMGQHREHEDGEEQIIAQIVELLKYSGDQLERELKKDKALMNSFQDQLCYPVFKIITDQFLRGVDTRGESEVRAQGFKAALAIDVTAKLTAIDNHPMNRVLGFGTKYLKDNFSPWVQQHGGWEKVLGISHEEVD